MQNIEYVMPSQEITEEKRITCIRFTEFILCMFYELNTLRLSKLIIFLPILSQSSMNVIGLI